MTISPDDVGLVGTSPWFSALPADVQTLVAAQLRPSRYPAGRALFHQGDQPMGLHVLLAGEMQVTGTAADGLVALMGILRPGDWTGFLAVLDKAPYALTVQAVTDSRAACLPLAAVRDVFERDVATFRLLVAPELMVSRRAYHFFVEMHGRSPLKRVAERLMDLGRWPYAEPRGPVSPLEVNQQDLAAATRLSRQTINSALRELEARGLVELGYGRIKVKDANALGKLVREFDASDG